MTRPSSNAKKAHRQQQQQQLISSGVSGKVKKPRFGSCARSIPASIPAATTAPPAPVLPPGNTFEMIWRSRLVAQSTIPKPSSDVHSGNRSVDMEEEEGEEDDDDDIAMSVAMSIMTEAKGHHQQAQDVANRVDVLKHILKRTGSNIDQYLDRSMHPKDAQGIGSQVSFIPKDPASWRLKLLVALRTLILYEPDRETMNRLLLDRVSARMARDNTTGDRYTTVKTDEVWEVVNTLKAEGRQVVISEEEAVALAEEDREQLETFNEDYWEQIE